MNQVLLSANQPIGIFDSGVGGLTVVRAVLSALPNEDLIYLGDTARVPYGTRSSQTVVRYSRNAARFLLQKNVKLVLIACNTASAAALPTLQSELEVPVLGAVDPGAQAAAAATVSRAIGVIGTLATIRSGAYTRALLAQDPRLRIHSTACPLLVPLCEEGWTDPDDAIAEGVARRYLSELRAQSADLDTLVLGCTHYPLLAPVLQRVSQTLWRHPVRLVDSAQAMAVAAQQSLESMGLLRTPEATIPESSGSVVHRRRGVDRLRCYVTDEARVAEVGARFLGRDLAGIEIVDL